MRVFCWPEKTYEELGTERWVCEWYTLPKNWKPEEGCEDESPDPDVMVCHSTAHKSKAAAIAAAKRHLKNGADFYGNPIVRKQIVDWYVEEDGIAEWTDCGEPIYLG